MKMWHKAVWRPWYSIVKSKLTSALVTILVATNGVSAGGQDFASVEPYVVHNDRGGYVRDRLREMRRLRATGQRVEIRGSICYSTCTMLLGLPQTCISPNTVFGFHGPSRNGRALRGSEFDYYSEVISQYYPAPLQRWYMEKARNKTSGVLRVRGDQIIKMGVQAC